MTGQNGRGLTAADRLVRELASTLFNILERKSLIKSYKLMARKYRLFTMALHSYDGMKGIR
jgi:hypothetical protein